jgi:hypothetical protein
MRLVGCLTVVGGTSGQVRRKVAHFPNSVSAYVSHILKCQTGALCRTSVSAVMLCDYKVDPSALRAYIGLGSGN